MKTKRRKRSNMTKDAAVLAVSEFSAKIKRWLETSENFYGDKQNSDDEIVVRLLVCGSFGSASSFFEGMRVLGGHKLPAKAGHD